MFDVADDAYARFMGRYSVRLAPVFLDRVGVWDGQEALDVGCGPGPLTAALVERLGAAAVRAVDPSAAFAAACARRFPRADVRVAGAEDIPFGDACVDVTLAQLVLPFVSDPAAAMGEMRRVTRPGGTVAACTWNLTGGMRLLRAYWDAALSVDPEAPDDALVLRFGVVGELSALCGDAGLVDVREDELTVVEEYASFDELWSGFMSGVGPPGVHCAGLPEDDRARVRDALFRGVGSPDGAFSLPATAHCVTGRVP